MKTSHGQRRDIEKAREWGARKYNNRRQVKDRDGKSKRHGKYTRYIKDQKKNFKKFEKRGGKKICKTIGQVRDGLARQ